ncbi:MAG TPA: hypothetical protein DCZ95_08780 [Verrucomicrobia bacterium]|nr:MAG: hypothetical protein A2X46_19375 [Lentisphaerae bacterium GWF2_57_35]HBA84171.1 hypothetical protein [Verrucomicrobiota bacterium]
MTPLESRKQLLLAESELNRAQLVSELAALTAGVRRLACRATALGAIASSAAVLATGLAAFHREQPVETASKSSRWPGILNGAVLISVLWLAFRAQNRDSCSP